MKNRKAIGVFVLIVGLVSFIIYQKFHQNQIQDQSNEQQEQIDKKITEETDGIDEQVEENQTISSDEKLAVQFVQKKMTGKYGLYTNFLDTTQKGEVATGHEILSESAGLYLCYSASRERKADFYDVLGKTRAYLNNGALFSYRYTPKTHEKASMNASIDDLRLIRALFKGAVIFQDDALQKETMRYGARFVKTNIKEDQLTDFYDSKTKVQAQYITLCYIDLDALKLLPMADQQKEDLLKKQKKILANGYLSDDFPLYKTRYDYKKKAYTDSEEINVIESLLTILHLSKESLEDPRSIEFLKKQVAMGSLYSRYDKEGNVLDQNQSTAAYALCALIAAVVHDQSFYQDAMNQLEKLQVKDTSTPLYGGFGNVETHESFSFDNLMALLAFTVSGQ